MSTTSHGGHRRPEHGWPSRPDGTGVTSASAVWARLRHAYETGTVLETLVALTTPEIAVEARLGAERSAMEQEIAGLKGELAQARSRIIELEQQVEASRTSAAQASAEG